MERENRLDKLFKSKLKDRPVAFDESNWKDFQKMQMKNNKPQKPKGFWWFGFSIVAILIIAIWLWNSPSELKDVVQNTSKVSALQETNNFEKSNPNSVNENDSIGEINISLEEDSDGSIGKITKVEKDESNLNNSVKPNNLNEKAPNSKPEGQVNNSVDDKVNSFNRRSKSSADLVSKNHSSLQNKSVANSNANKKSKSNSSAEHRFSSGNNINGDNYTIETKDEISAQITAEVGLNNNSVKEEVIVVNQVQEEATNSETDSNIIAKNERVTHLVDSAKLTSDSSETLQMMAEPKRKSEFNFYIAPTVELNFISKKISGSDLSDEYLQRRKNEEDNLSKVFYNLQIHAELNRFGVYTGITRSEYGEKINYQPISNSLQIDSILTLELDSIFVIDSNGTGHYEYFNDSIFTSDSSVVAINNPEISSRNGATKITYFEIPLVFYYKFNAGKFTIDVGPGIAFGFLKSVKASYFNTSVTGLEMMDDKKNYRKTIYNLLLNAGVRYNFNNSLSFRLDVKYRTNLNSVFNSDYIVTQRYNSIGVGLGLAIKF